MLIWKFYEKNLITKFNDELCKRLSFDENFKESKLFKDGKSFREILISLNSMEFVCSREQNDKIYEGKMREK